MGLIPQAARVGSRSRDDAPLNVNGPVTYFPCLLPGRWVSATQAQSVQGVTSLAGCTVQRTKTRGTKPASIT